MPSKKKARGNKARKAAKAEKEGEKKDAVANNEAKSDGGGVLDNHQDDEDALLEEAIKLVAAEKEELEAAAKNDEAKNTVVKCHHGFVLFTEGDVCGAFIQSLIHAGKKKTSNIYDGFEQVYERQRKQTTPKYGMIPISASCNWLYHTFCMKEQI
jgi:hypothetical protein